MMDNPIDKSKIIAAINETDDEWILFAINRLLRIDAEEVPVWHKEVVEQRWNDMKNGKAVFAKWEDVQKKIFKR